MEFSLVILLLIVGAIFGGLIVYAFRVDGEDSEQDSIYGLHCGPDDLEQRSRRVQ